MPYQLQIQTQTRNYIQIQDEVLNDPLDLTLTLWNLAVKSYFILAVHQLCNICFPRHNFHSPSFRIGTMRGFICAIYTMAHLQKQKKNIWVQGGINYISTKACLLNRNLSICILDNKIIKTFEANFCVKRPTSYVMLFISLIHAKT